MVKAGWHRVGGHMVETDDKGYVVRAYVIADTDEDCMMPMTLLKPMTLNAFRIRHTRNQKLFETKK